MKKEDLKSGMLVELRNEKVLMVLNLMLIRADGDYYPLSYYNDDLTFYKEESEGHLDIVNVSNVQNGAASTTKNWTPENITNDLLWQREEKEMIDIDGVEYDKYFINEAIERQKAWDNELKKTIKEEPKGEKTGLFEGVGKMCEDYLYANGTLTKEEPKEEKKPFVIEYEINKSYMVHVDDCDICCDVYKKAMEHGRYRKAKANAEYSVKRNQRANRLEALVEYFQGELGVGAYCKIKWGGDEFYQRMKMDTYYKIREILNNEEYSLEG